MYRTTSGTSTIFSGGQLILRPYGLLPHANVLGGLLAAALPLVFSVLYSPPGSGRSRRALYWHYLRVGTIIATLVLVIAALALSYSRSAWIGLVAALLYVMWRYRIHWNFSRRTMHIAAISSLLVALMVGLQWNVVAARLIPRQRTEVLSIQQRLFLLNLTLHVIAWRPLTGVGGNNLVYGEARFRPKAVGSTTGILPVHNTYLLAEAELGPLGGIAWLALMLVPISGLWLEATAIRRRRTTNGRRAPPTRPAIVATRSSRAIIHDSNEQLNIFAGAALIVVAVAGLFDFYITANEPVALLWIVSLALFAQSGPQEAGVARYNR